MRRKSPKTSVDPGSVIHRSHHTVTRQNISENALKVLYRLKKGGFEAYLVGGGVRDLLLSLKPKDFDVATSATPQQIRRLFKNCRLIGKRFRLAHIHFGREIVEVATFRGTGDDDRKVCEETGRITRDNTFGSLEEDAWRRDITINALYYTITDFSIVDLTGGMQDIKDKIIRMIGNPEQRYIEDPVRMLRVVRLAAKLGFSIEKKTLAPIARMASSLEEMSNARLFDEVIKLFHTGAALETFHQLYEYKLFQVLFPQTTQTLEACPKNRKLIESALNNTDKRIHQEKTVTPAFLFSVLLWQPLQNEIAQCLEDDLPHHQAYQQASHHVIQTQIKRVSIPKRFSTAINDIWQLQNKLTRKVDKRAMNTVTHPRFRAAYDFLLLRAEIEPNLKPRAEWWTEFQTLTPEEQEVKLAKTIRRTFKRHSKKKA